jgi:hypothetical protein
VIGGKVRVSRRLLIEDSPKEGEGAKDIGLVDAGDPPGPTAMRAPVKRQLKGEPEQLLRNIAGDQQRLAGLVPRHLAPALRVEQTFRALADQNKIHLAPGRDLQRRSLARDDPHRAHSSEQHQRLAQVDLRRNLGPVGIAHVRQAHRRQQDGISGTGRDHRAFRQRLAGRREMCRPRRNHREVQIVAARDLGNTAQNRDRGRDYFRPDPVTLEHGNLELLLHRAFSDRALMRYQCIDYRIH